jgi:hypothetical protein
MGKLICGESDAAPAVVEEQKNNSKADLEFEKMLE